MIGLNWENLAIVFLFITAITIYGIWRKGEIWIE